MIGLLTGRLGPLAPTSRIAGRASAAGWAAAVAHTCPARAVATLGWRPAPRIPEHLWRHSPQAPQLLASRPLTSDAATAHVPWGDAEDAALGKLVEDPIGQFSGGDPDWEAVATQLGTGRAATAVEQRWAVLQAEAKDAEWGAVKDGEWNGPVGPEPTRYNDWEQKGRCTDF